MRCYFLFVLHLCIFYCLNAQTPALIIGDGVRVRATAGVKGQELAKLKTGDTVHILEVSNQKDGLGSDNMCDSFPWIEVETAAKIRGWVFGKYVYAPEQNAALLPPDFAVFTLKGQSYTLQLYRDYGIGAAQYGELTGCDDFHLLAVQEVSSGRIYPVHALPDKVLTYKSAKFIRLDTNDGVGESVTGVRVEKGKAVLSIRVEYQDGSGNYSVELQPSGGQWKGRIFGLKND